ncbi:MAG: hypothetical protein IPM26_01055 [Saprospiraceae bacterium]|nr:hypothetical protein [Saprospiraceae bacterium]
MRNYGYVTKVNSFCEISSFDFTRQLTEKIKSEIEGKGKEYILGVDEEEYKNYLIEKYSLEPLTIDYNSETIDEPTVSKEWLEDRFFREKYQAEVFNFTIRYNFTGSPVLFKVQPSTWTMTSAEIYVDEQNNTVSFSFKLYKKDPEEFKRTKIDYQRRAFANLSNINQVVTSWMNSLPGTVNSLFQQTKNKYLQENDFFAAINVKVNKDTTSVFTAPTIRKKIIPQPTVSKNKEFSSEPMMAKEMYDDILKVIYDLGKSMEKKPSTYQGKDEEGIRDQFLLVLETRYDSTTATGETFNKGGKTDIILKYSKDGSNLFVAECKFWHGASEFHKAITQLFDRYLTWRDSKAALILFVTNKDFSNVIEIIKSEAEKHPYFLKFVGKRGETSFSYHFHLPQDKNKTAYFEIIAFHYDK